MIRILLLTLLLASCGGDGDGDSSGGGSSIFSFMASDPYVVDGVFFYDQNNNGIYEAGEPVSTPTDTMGNGTFSTIIPEGGKIIQLTGGIMDGFNYSGKLKGISNGVGGIVLSPLTTLSTNGFTNEEIVALLGGVGIPISQDQINQNPMTDPTLLRAALTISQGLSDSLKGYDLSPSDIMAIGPSAFIKDPYTQQLFAEAAIVYSQIITEEDFDSNLTNLSKVSSSFLNYMDLYGASDFASPTQVEDAKNSLYSVVNRSMNSYEPVTLLKTPTGFNSQVLRNEWFSDGTYDLIGFNSSNIYTRIIDNTISNYPFSPWEVEVILLPSTIEGQKMLSSGDPSRQETWTVNPTSNTVDYSSSFNQGNFSRPTNTQTINGLPISTYIRSNNMVLRGTAFRSYEPSINEQGLRLIGMGEGIYTYYGIDWGEIPNDPQFWNVNQSRTNNCLIGNELTANCMEPGVTGYYDSQKENSTEKSIIALTQANELGNPLPANYELNFVLKNTPLGASMTTQPEEFIVSQIQMEPANLVTVNCPNNSNRLCLAVKPEGAIIPRPALENTQGVSFVLGGNFPEDYKVYAVNNVLVKTTSTSGKYCLTTGSSSFFKANILVLKIDCKDAFPEVEYLFVDMITKRGIVGSYSKAWLEGSTEKFKYRNFSEINLKNVIP